MKNLENEIHFAVVDGVAVTAAASTFVPAWAALTFFAFIEQHEAVLAFFALTAVVAQASSAISLQASALAAFFAEALVAVLVVVQQEDALAFFADAFSSQRTEADADVAPHMPKVSARAMIVIFMDDLPDRW